MAPGQKVLQRPTEIECPSWCSSSPPLQWLIAVLKPVYDQPCRLNWPCMGSAPPINILLFSQTRHLIFKREKHCIVINLISLPACCSASPCDLGRWVNLPQHCWRVVWPGEGSWAAQGEVKSPSAQQWRFIASPLETPVTVLPMTDCQPNNEPFVPSHHSWSPSFHQTYTPLTISILQRK